MANTKCLAVTVRVSINNVIFYIYLGDYFKILILVFKGTFMHRLSKNLKEIHIFYKKLIFNVKTSFDRSDFCANSFLKYHLTDFIS